MLSFGGLSRRRLCSRPINVVLLSLISLICARVGYVQSACPTGWTDSGTACYSILSQSSPFVSTVEARQLCLANNGDLASFVNSSDAATVYSLIRTMNTTTLPSYVYIGISDVSSYGNFTYLNNANSTYNNLSATQMSNVFISQAYPRCVAMTSSDGLWQASGANITWVTMPCCFQIYSIKTVACTQQYSGPPSNSSTNVLQQYCYGSCQTGWRLYQGNCYLLMNANRTLNGSYDARQTCLTQGADLLSVPTQNISSYVVFLMNATAQSQNFVNITINVYIGTNDIQTMSVYNNLDGTATAYLNWASGQPNNAATPDGRKAVCGQLSWTIGATSSAWLYDVSCCTPTNIQWLACQKPSNGSVSVAASQDILAAQCAKYSYCASAPCLNNGTCNSLIFSYNCTCAPGFSGAQCETQTNFCLTNPCVNGGSCNTVGYNYVCTCPTWYTGTQCETLSSQCYSYPCQQNGTCTGNSTSYTCACPPGTTGVNCQTDINMCANVTCQNGGSCVSSLNLATCNCLSMYTGSLCETLLAGSCPLISVANATITNATANAGNANGAVQTYQCLTGFMFPEMTTTQTYICQNGVWSQTPATACLRSCPGLPIVANAVALNANSFIGTTLNYTCTTGYILANNQTSVNTTCLPSGNWSSSLAGVSCQLRLCPVLPIWPHQTLDTFNNTYNTTVTFWCDVGYVLFDNTTARTIQCLADGTWTADLPPCNPVVCPIIQPPTNTKANTSNNTYMTYAQYTCTSGMRMLDGATYRIILCDAGAQWSDVITNCTTTRCFPLPYVANATPSTTVADYWTQSILTCIKGHRFTINSQQVDKAIMTCQQNGWWYPILTACQPVLCGPIPTGNNSIPSTTDQLYGTTVIYTCYTGYYVYTPGTGSNSVNGMVPAYTQMSSNCLDIQQWNNTNIQPCWPIVCPSPPPITNGTWTLPASYNYTALVNYQCAAGTKFIDGRINKNLACTQYGSWNESDVSCKSDRCGPLNLVLHATPDTTNTSWYTNATYRCNIGYYWPNNVTSVTLYCQPGGQWNATFTEANDCLIKSCPPVMTMGNATANDTVHVYNTYIGYMCNTGFLYSDNSTVKAIWCSDQATWQPINFPQCQIIHCPPLLDVENATRNSNDTYFNKTITYTSLPGYQFPDKTKSKTITCTANGTWTAYPPPCEVVFCPPLPIWSSTNFNTTDNNFLSTVSYTCPDGYAFPDYKTKPGNQTVLTSLCEMSKVWYPAIQTCSSLTAINAAIVGKSWESPQGVPIGTVACTMMCLLLAFIIVLDLKKLYNDLKMFKNNTLSMCRENKVTPQCQPK